MIVGGIGAAAAMLAAAADPNPKTGSASRFPSAAALLGEVIRYTPYPITSHDGTQRLWSPWARELDPEILRDLAWAWHGKVSIVVELGPITFELPSGPTLLLKGEIRDFPTVDGTPSILARVWVIDPKRRWLPDWLPIRPMNPPAFWDDVDRFMNGFPAMYDVIDNVSVVVPLMSERKFKRPAAGGDWESLLPEGKQVTDMGGMCRAIAGLEEKVRGTAGPTMARIERALQDAADRERQREERNRR